MKVYEISTGRPVTVTVPEEIQLPESEEINGVIVTSVVSYHPGEPGWDDAVERWLLLQA